MHLVLLSCLVHAAPPRAPLDPPHRDSLESRLICVYQDTMWVALWHLALTDNDQLVAVGGTKFGSFRAHPHADYLAIASLYYLCAEEEKFTLAKAVQGMERMLSSSK